jgi:hypothetical protein
VDVALALRVHLGEIGERRVDLVAHCGTLWHRNTHITNEKFRSETPRKCQTRASGESRWDFGGHSHRRSCSPQP